ncbi:MAG: hypothetical protein R2764_24350 [Bacteroidales bacterium]
MRKVSILSGLAMMLFVAAIALLNSCNKQETPENPVANKQEIVMNEEDIAVYNKIMAFKNKVDYIKENPEYKNGEAISVDSAVWYLDATVNLTYTFSFEYFNDFYTDSVFVEIPAVNGEIYMNDLSDAYFELVDKIRDSIYAIVQNENKKLYVSTSMLKDESSSLIIVKNIATVGSTQGNQVINFVEEPFELGDDFMYGDLRGYCNGDSAFYLDAASKLAYFTAYNRPLYIQDEGVTSSGIEWRAYYTGGVIIYLDPAQEYGDLFKCPENNFGIYKYLCEDNPSDLCLYHDCMNFYYAGLHEVIYDIVPANWLETNGLTFRYCENQGTHNGSFNTPSKIYHLPDIMYKQRWIMYERDYPIEM